MNGPFVNLVTPNFFSVVGLTIRDGRGFTEWDRAGTQKVVIVNSTFARFVWPGRNAVGRCLFVGGEATDCTTVVGVAESPLEFGLQDTDRIPQYYLPLAQALSDAEVPEVPPIENPHLLRTQEQRTGHMRGCRESTNVTGQEPRPGVGHPVFGIQQPQVPERHHPIHGFRDLGAAAEPGPGLLIQIALDREVRTRLPVEVKTSSRVEEVLDLSVRHLLAARPVAQEESPAERVGLTLLWRYDDAENLPNALDYHLDRRVRRPCGTQHS